MSKRDLPTGTVDGDGDDAVANSGQNQANPDVATDGPSECKKQKPAAPEGDPTSSMKGSIAEDGVQITYGASFTPGGHFKVEGEVKEATVGEEVFGSDSIELPMGVGPLVGGLVEISETTVRQMMRAVMTEALKKMGKGSTSSTSLTSSSSRSRTGATSTGSKSKTRLSIPSSGEKDNELDQSRNIEGYVIQFNEHLFLSNEEKVEEEGISFRFTGYENKIDALAMKLGKGALIFHVSSEDKIGIIRIQPPEGKKSLSVISWKQADNGINIICK